MTILTAKKLTATTTRSNTTTLTDDTELTLSLAASTTYIIEGMILLSPVTGTGAPKFNFNYTGTTTRGYYTAYSTNNFQTKASGVISPGLSDRVSLATVTSYPTNPTSEVNLHICGLITTGTSGTFSLAWAQVVSDPTPANLFPGSWLMFTTA